MSAYTNPTPPMERLPDPRVTWAERGDERIIEVADGLAAEVQYLLPVTVHAELDVPSDFPGVALHLWTDGTDGGRDVYVIAGSGGSISARYDPTEPDDDPYNLNHPSKNPGGQDWLDVFPARVASMLYGREVAA